MFPRFVQALKPSTNLKRYVKVQSCFQKGIYNMPLMNKSNSLLSQQHRGFLNKKENFDTTNISVDDIPVHELTGSNNKWEMVYEGFLHAGIRRLKIFSFSSMVISLVSVPVILTFETESIPMSGKIALAIVTFLIGVSTTAVINYFTKAYVMRMFISRANPNMIEAVSLSLTGKLVSSRMFATDAFTATDGVKYMCSFKHIPSQKSFFIHDAMATHPVFSVMMPHLFEDSTNEHDDIEEAQAQLQGEQHEQETEQQDEVIENAKQEKKQEKKQHA